MWGQKWDTGPSGSVALKTKPPPPFKRNQEKYLPRAEIYCRETLAAPIIFKWVMYRLPEASVVFVELKSFVSNALIKRNGTSLLCIR